MSKCPCCSSPLLRHFRQGKQYWFCRHCWAEMSPLDAQETLITLPRVPVKAAGRSRVGAER